ncbi:Asp-tRNA(Asn)/Glu-tRNA(Gln) amidotransferase subunit GatA [soil metagenome]
MSARGQSVRTVPGEAEKALDGGVVTVAAGVNAGSLAALAVSDAALARIAQRNGGLNALTQVFIEESRTRARAIDAAVARGEPGGALAGVPIALKENICATLGRTTAGSRALENYVSPFDAAVVERLRGAGAVLIARANCDEFAMGGTGEHSAFGATRNPFDATRVPGGSSSGSAAAVGGPEGGMVPAALGSDTGGSIRQPAGWCGIVGIKPTYGRVSRWGLVAFASSLDQIGPLARSVEDAALVLDVIAGPDARDATCVAPAAAPGAFVEAARRGARGDFTGLKRKIGIARQGIARANHPAVNESIERTRAHFSALGFDTVEVDLPHAEFGIAAYYIIAAAEASSNLARYDGVRYGHRAALRPGEGLDALYARSRSEGFGPEVQRRIMLGTHVLSSGYFDAYYTTALRARRVIRADFERAFAEGCAAVVLPCSPGPALRLGEKRSDPLALYLEDVYTVGVNLAGVPAVALPMGSAEVEGVALPLGVQLIGAMRAEETILTLAAALESAEAQSAVGNAASSRRVSA